MYLRVCGIFISLKVMICDMNGYCNKEDFAGYGIDTPLFSLCGLKCWARVVGVYDGDSPTLVVPFGGDGKYYRFASRMYGIDTSEMKSKDEQNKERALRARGRLIELVTCGQVSLPLTAKKKDVVDALSRDVYLVWIECMEMDKYGRVLHNMYRSPEAGEKSFADILIEEGLAYAYFGGTKMTESEQVSYK